ncbi:MAG: hypothetical protein IJ696_01540 [Ruminococcus sp.]|nr:hypothetical protein [Ruminococcus sp.]
MTSVKRRIVAFVGAALMAGTMAMGVSAANNPRKYKPSGSNSEGIISGNPMKKSTTTNGIYGWMYANNNQTKMTVNQQGDYNGYDVSYKIAKFYPWRYNASTNDFDLITIKAAQKENSGSSKTVGTSTIEPKDTWAKRSNLGYLYYTNKDSYPVEFHYSNVVKPR